MLNWNIIPMTYNDSFTYMEWLGKLTYIAENHEERIDAAEKDIVDLKEKVDGLDERVGTLETWRVDVVDPFIETIGTWKTDVVDPFIVSTSFELASLRSDLTAESSTRANADDALSQRITDALIIAKDALTKVNRIDINLNNEGAIRYYVVNPTITDNGTDTTFSVLLPDEDWGTIDVRFGLIENSAVVEYRLTGLRSETQHQTTQNGKNFWFAYDSTTNSVSVTVMATLLTSSDLYRFDYILYRGALDQSEQDAADEAFYEAMDANGDGYVDARDASAILAFVADVNAGVIPEQYTGQEAWAWYCANVNTNLNPTAYPDFNGDGKITSVDASYILGFYAYATEMADSELTGAQLMREYRTQLTSAQED